jgi:hypothetical protein
MEAKKTPNKRVQVDAPPVERRNQINLWRRATNAPAVGHFILKAKAHEVYLSLFRNWRFRFGS